MIKKYFISILFFTIVFLSASAVCFADMQSKTNNTEKSDKEVDIIIENMADAENFLQEYFKKNHVDIVPGSEEYICFLNDLLTFENDEVLKGLEQYDSIKYYAGEYLDQINDEEKIIKLKNKLILNDNEKFKTIETVKKEAHNENLEARVDNSVDLRTKPDVYGYSDSKAIEYAKKWAKGRNKKYNKWASDCTNFVSQCVVCRGQKYEKAFENKEWSL